MSSLDQHSCIYCGKVRQFTDEHVFPAGLGGDDRRFLLSGMVCGHCNTEIFSKLELRFMRSSPVAIGRTFLQPTGRKRGKKRNIPTIDTRSIVLFTKEYGAVEAEVTTLGFPVILTQMLFLGDGKIGHTGTKPEESIDFLHHLVSILDDLVSVVQKCMIDKKNKYFVKTLNWNGEHFVFASYQTMVHPPVNCIWQELLMPSQNGDISRNPTLYRRLAGQIVLRLPADGNIIDLLTLARKATPKILEMPIDTSLVENPVVQLDMLIGLSDNDRVYAKIGMNLIAYAFGENYIRHHAFNKVKQAILTGNSSIQVGTSLISDDPFNGVPKDRHVAMVCFEKSRAGRFYVFFVIRLYGAEIKYILLTKNAIQPPKRDAILVVHYKDHHIEEFSDTMQFVKAYPLTLPVEFKQQVISSMFPKLNLNRS